MPPEKTIQCAVCGIDVQVQRLSARYCGDCKPKALVLNTVIRKLNQLANVDPMAFADLIDNSVPVSSAMAEAFPMLEEVIGIGLLGTLNIALSDYGRIGYIQGSGFKIVSDVAQRITRLGGLRYYVTNEERPERGDNPERVISDEFASLTEALERVGLTSRDFANRIVGTPEEAEQVGQAYGRLMAEPHVPVSIEGVWDAPRAGQTILDQHEVRESRRRATRTSRRNPSASGADY